jgi:hypothetical protein
VTLPLSLYKVEKLVSKFAASKWVQRVCRYGEVRAAVNAIREERGVTPRVVYVRGGADDPR